MAEVPGRVAVFDLAAAFREVGFGYGNECDYDESECEHTHCNPEQGSHIAHCGGGAESADESAYEERGKGAGEGVERTAGLYKLVARVAAAAEKVEHGVNHGVEHTYAETADKRAKEVDIEVEGNCCAAYGPKGDVGTYNTRQPLYKKTGHAHSHGPESCFLITDACKEVAGRNTHKEIGCEVHHVAHHAEHGVAFKFVAPYRADGGGEIGYERNHRKEEEHGNDSHYVTSLRRRSRC